MSDYLQLYTFRIEHDYYRHFDKILIHPTANTSKLMKSRDIIFKQISINEWTIIGNHKGAGIDESSDIFVFDMITKASDLMHFAELENYDLNKAYTLDLPLKDKTEAKINDLLVSCETRRKNGVFATIKIEITNQMIFPTDLNNPIKNTIRFTASKAYWEYIFIKRGEGSVKNILLEDKSGEIKFKKRENPDIGIATGESMVTFISESEIINSNRHDIHLILYEIIREEPIAKRTIIRLVPYPRIGAFISDKVNIIRQICYY